MSETINVVELENWYRQQIIAQAKKAKSQRRLLFFSIKFYMWMVIGGVTLILLLFLLLHFVLEGEGSGKENRLQTMAILLSVGLLGFGGISFFVYALSVSKINSFETLRNAGVICAFKNLKNSRLVKMLEELTAQMEISFSRLRIWKVLSPQAYPSVEEDKEGNIHLVIPPHFLLMVQNDPAKAKAILAHELGHVLQSDSKLFLITETYYTVVRQIFIPLILIGIFLKVYMLVTSPEDQTYSNIPVYIAFILDAIMIVFLISGFDGVREARKQSELLADTAAVLYTGDRSIIAVLEDLSNTPASPIHPDKKTRLEHAEKIISEYNLQPE